MGENGLIALNFWRNDICFYYNSVKIKFLQNYSKEDDTDIRQMH